MCDHASPCTVHAACRYHSHGPWRIMILHADSLSHRGYARKEAAYATCTTAWLPSHLSYHTYTARQRDTPKEITAGSVPA